MRCHQCERPAIYRIGDKSLCLNCADKLQSLADRQQSITDRQFIQNAAMMNMAMDDIDASVLDQENKRELLDLVQSLADQVVRERKASVIKALLKSIEERAQGVAAVFEIAQGGNIILDVPRGMNYLQP